jgi:uncharacterized protein
VFQIPVLHKHVSRYAPHTISTMKRVFFILVFLCCSTLVFAQEKCGLYSSHVQDSFDIFITKGKLTEGHSIRYIYYLDAGIKSGKELRRQLGTASDSSLKNRIYVGIGHKGKFHQKRRRDFLPKGEGNAGTKNPFYLFLENELIPFVEQKYGSASGRSLLGHSFGGLFTISSMFRADRLFDTYFALSPSLWVNHYAIFEQEQAYNAQEQRLPVFFYLSTGSREKLNRILYGNRRLKVLFERRNYQGLQLVYKEHKGKTHNSQVPLSIKALVNHSY